MICKYCQSAVPDGTKFCTNCGADLRMQAVPPPQAATSAQPAAGPQIGVPDAALEKKSKRRAGKPVRVILTVVCAAVLTLLVIALCVALSNQARFQKGVSLVEQEEYAQAKEIFVKLRDTGKPFGDASGDLLRHCNDMLLYEEAKSCMEQGDYVGALDAFGRISIACPKDSMQRMRTCQDEAAYAEATTLAETDPVAAGLAFKDLGDFRDAAALAERYGGKERYDEAAALLEKGDYAGAQALFEALADIGYEDAAEKAAYCADHIALDAAEALYEKKAYYEAYKAFDALGNFENAPSRKKACIQAFPATGEAFHNSGFAAKSCSLTIKPSASDGNRNYVKIYAEDGTLVSILAIGKGDRAKAWLPAGNYRIKNAYGTGDWFGETDMFGDEGKYQLLKNGSGDNDIFALKSGYEYTLSLRSADKLTGDAVGTENQNREDF